MAETRYLHAYNRSAYISHTTRSAGLGIRRWRVVSINTVLLVDLLVCAQRTSASRKKAQNAPQPQTASHDDGPAAHKPACSRGPVNSAAALSTRCPGMRGTNQCINATAARSKNKVSRTLPARKSLVFVNNRKTMSANPISSSICTPMVASNICAVAKGL